MSSSVFTAYCKPGYTYQSFFTEYGEEIVAYVEGGRENAGLGQCGEVETVERRL